MNESLFLTFVRAFFPSLNAIIEKINGKKNAVLTYLHKDTNILRKVFSPDNKWESTSVNTTYVAADIVALDSELPLKSRDAVASANGKLPKLGISKMLKETDITNLNVLEAQGGNAQRIRKKLADDPVACASGLDEMLEYAFLSGLCEGAVGMPNAENPQSLIRLDFGYLPSHTFGATEKGKVSLNDIIRVIDNANKDDNTIIKIWLSKTTFDALRQTQEARELVANYMGNSYKSGDTLPVPTSARFQEAFEDETNVTFQIVNRSVQFEKDGKKISKKPWNDNRLVFLCNEQVGSLVYGQLAESTNPVKGVVYSLLDDFKLISKYSQTNPLREVTSGQAIVAPIIEDVDQIYILDISEAQEVDEAKELEDTTDVKITLWGKEFTKTDVVEKFKAIIGQNLKANISDKTLVTKVNELSDEEESALKTALG